MFATMPGSTDIRGAARRWPRAGGGLAYPRCTVGRREAPSEDCGGIWAFNEYQAELDDTFDAGEVTARLAGREEVLIPAS